MIPTRRFARAGLLLAAALAPAALAASARVSAAYPGTGPWALEGYRPLDRRYMAVVVGRVLQRYGADFEVPGAAAPPDAEDLDLPWITRAVAAGVVRLRKGKLDARARVTRLELAFTLDRLMRRCRGQPPRVAKRRFPYPTDVDLSGPARDALNRILRLRIMRADDRRFRPRKTASRYRMLVAADRLTRLLDSRPERQGFDFSDLPESHWARRSVQSCYRRGLIGPPIFEPGLTREDPPPHRLLGRFAEVNPLAERPFQPRLTPSEFASAVLPGTETLRAHQDALVSAELELGKLLVAWDELRVLGRAAGSPRARFLGRVARARRRVGRTHLELGRLLDDLSKGPRDGPDPAVRAELGPRIRASEADAEVLFRRFTALFDEARGVLPETPPSALPRNLPLAARSSPLSSLGAGGELEAARRAATALLRAPEQPVLGAGGPLRGRGVVADAALDDPTPLGAPSPGGAASSPNLGGALGDDLGDDLGGGLGDDLGGGLGDDPGDDLGGGLGDDLGDDLGGGLGDDLGGDLGDDLDGGLGDDLGDDLGDL